MHPDDVQLTILEASPAALDPFIDLLEEASAWLWARAGGANPRRFLGRAVRENRIGVR